MIVTDNQRAMPTATSEQQNSNKRATKVDSSYFFDLRRGKTRDFVGNFKNYAKAMALEVVNNPERPSDAWKDIRKELELIHYDYIDVYFLHHKFYGDKRLRKRKELDNRFLQEMQRHIIKVCKFRRMPSSEILKLSHKAEILFECIYVHGN